MKKTIVLLFFLLSFAMIGQPILPQTGYASYYSWRFKGHKTASGERYCLDSFTAAHRTLPFGTHIKVINLDNDRWTIVRINDRGPKKRSRIIDLSLAAAKALGMVKKGIAHVRLEPVASENNDER